LDYQPQITKKGEAALYVLSHSDGTLSVQQLSNHVMKEYPCLFADFKQASLFVQGLIKCFG
jgi:protein arginine N-methyltransferase 1